MNTGYSASLPGQVAVVTGSDTGIGAACIRRLTALVLKRNRDGNRAAHE